MLENEAIIELEKLSLRLNLIIMDCLKKDAETKIKEYQILNDLKIEALKAMDSINAQIATGALSSVSAAAHIS